jgi:hypothetical protein
MALSSIQRGVAFGMAGGVVASAAVWLVPWIAPVPALPAGDGSRLAFWLPWELPPLATLAYGIAWTAQYRFFHASVIDGQNPLEDRELASGRAYLQNTLEQFMLAFAVHAVLAVVLPVRYLSVLPALTVWFAFSRVLFRAGYSKGAAARSFGFAGTFYPSLIGMAVASMFALLG